MSNTPQAHTDARVVDLAAFRAARERPASELHTSEGRRRARGAATGELALREHKLAVLDLELRVANELGEVPNIVRRELRELLPVLEDHVTRRLAEPPMPPTVRWARARRLHVARESRTVLVCRRASAAPHERSAGATTAFPLAPCPDLIPGNAWNASMSYGPPRSVPPRAAHASKPLTLTERATLLPWEEAVTILVGRGIHRRRWPAPYERDPSAGEFRAVDAARRRTLVVRCEELELKPDAEVYFARFEVQEVLTSPALASRVLETDDEVYLHGAEAAALLRNEQAAPSTWPTIYVTADGFGHGIWTKPQPTSASERDEHVRALFRGVEAARPTFMLEYEVRTAIRTAHARRAQPRNANEAIEQFNRQQSQTMARMRDEVTARTQRADHDPSEAAPTSERTSAEAGTPASDSVAPNAADRQHFRLEWHEDLAAVVKERINIDTRAAIAELCKLEKYDSRPDPNGGSMLVLPGGKEVSFRRVGNKLSDLRRELQKLKPT